MAAQKIKVWRNGDPKPSAEEVEQAIEHLKAENTRTEAWMSARARNKMRDLEEKDAALRDAFESGYRMGADSNLWLVGLTFLVALATLILIAEYVTGWPS